MKAAQDFVKLYHRHNIPPVGGKFAISVYEGNRLCGVAICGRPVSRYLDNGLTLEIYRCCTDGTRNACSKLFGTAFNIAFKMVYKKIINYTLKSENGASLKASGFTLEGECGGTNWTGERRRDYYIAPQEKKNRWSKVKEKG